MSTIFNTVAQFVLHVSSKNAESAVPLLQLAIISFRILETMHRFNSLRWNSQCLPPCPWQYRFQIASGAVASSALRRSVRRAEVRTIRNTPLCWPPRLMMAISLPRTYRCCARRDLCESLRGVVRPRAVEERVSNYPEDCAFLLPSLESSRESGGLQNMAVNKVRRTARLRIPCPGP